MGLLALHHKIVNCFVRCLAELQFSDLKIISSTKRWKHNNKPETSVLAHIWYAIKAKPPLPDKLARVYFCINLYGLSANHNSARNGATRSEICNQSFRLDHNENEIFFFVEQSLFADSYEATIAL